jgi:hypothetical protein
MNDVEMFLGCRRIEVRCDLVKVGFRCPFRAWRKPSLFTALLELALAEIGPAILLLIVAASDAGVAHSAALMELGT